VNDTAQRGIWLAGLLALAACGPPPQKDTFYRLPASPSASAATADGPMLQVPPFGADGLLNERALIYARADGTSLEQYNHHFWVDSPRLLLQQALSEELVRTLRARVVDGPTAGAHAVRGRIVRLERTAGSGPAARVALQFEVYPPSGGAAVFRRGYERDLESSDDGVAAIAAALGRACQEIITQFVGELGREWGTVTASSE
jgi:ABC-type uncharacterized transport system auxiliary subunit